MTDIEIDFIKNHLCNRDCIGFQYRECDECAVQEILDKLNKYKRHDLRKNPDDLPKEHQVLVVCDLFGGRYHDIVYYGKPLAPCCKVDGEVFYRANSEYGDVPVENVLAWWYMPPFEEDEK